MFNISEHNFVRSCQRGEVLPDNIDDFIDDWHDHDYAVELHEFLGMSWEEYRGWVANPNTLPQIIEAHHNNKTATLATSPKFPNQSMSIRVNDWLQSIPKSLGIITSPLGVAGPIADAVAAASSTVERVVRLKNGERIELSVNEDGIGTLTGYFREPDSVKIIISEPNAGTVIPLGRVGNKAVTTLELRADQEIPIWLEIKEQGQLENLCLSVYSV